MLRRMAATGRSERIPRLSWLLLSAGAAASGCAHGPSRTMSQTWQSVPSISWARPSDAGATGQHESEPTVAANAPSEQTEPKSPEGGSRLFRWSSLTGSKPQAVAGEETKPPAPHKEKPQDPFLEEELLAQARKMDLEEDEEDPPVRARRARIKAALDDDSRSAQTLALAKQEQDRLKLRVEALSDRARQLLDEGDLQAAQRTAELAQSLVQTGELEFEPEEQRPVDLLAQINHQLESESPQDAELTPDELGESAEQLSTDTKSLSPETQVRLTGKSETAAESPSDFDPFAKPEALAGSRDEANPLLETPPVVLEAPNFDEDLAETAAAGDGNRPVRPPAAGRSLTIAELSTSQHRNARQIPSLPVDDEDDAVSADLETFAPRDGESEALPRAETPAVATTELDSAEPLPQPEVFSLEDEGEQPADIRPASVWPRWMPISGLCLLTGAFGIWFWRKQSALRS